jgi:DNA repair protein RecN (Recombination protein N)
MLRYLRATNFAILSDVELELGAGMNVLTGETGAGKSLIVEAVNLLRGGRASADIPRAGADEAVVEAVVEVPDELRARVAGVLEGAGLPEGDQVLVRRVIQRGGRSRCYVNGALTTAARLGELGALLVDLSGQHQHQGLVDAGRHLDILDAFAGCAAERVAMTAAWDELRRCDDALAQLAGNDRDREARLDYTRFQLDELDAAALAPGEDKELEIERARLAAVDQLQAAARGAEGQIYGEDGSARDRVAAAARDLERVAKSDPQLGALAVRLRELEMAVDDIAGELRAYADHLEGDPARLAEVEDRIAMIRRLVRKHGGDLADVIAKATELRAELTALASHDTRLAETRAARGAAETAAVAMAAVLTKKRAKAARVLEKQVGAALAELGMSAARLGVAIEQRVVGPAGRSESGPLHLGSTGADRIELMLAANKGEDPRPLAKIASGGELSRIMLAMKLVLRRADEVATYVFDEVDAGIGGQAAQAVGAQIRAVADHRQVLCVTHLPQIAAYADHHFHVEKTELGGRTETHVRELTGAARKDELARMLGGHATARAKAHAAELLAEARRSARV